VKNMKRTMSVVLVVAVIVATLTSVMPSVKAASRRPDMAKSLPGNSTRIALIRLEDVSPWYALDPKRLQLLRYIADYLASRHVPFQVAMIPVYLDPAAGIRIGIDAPDDPRAKEFIATIHYMTSKGGVIGLHGYTHQMDEGVTGESSEFSDNPHAIESTVAYMAPRVDAALAAAKAANIPITFWETPHYTASPEQYTYLESRFSIIYEPGPTNHRTKEPFLLSSSKPATGKVCFIPTPLGMVQGPKQTQSIVSFADNSHQQILASLFFHPFRERLPSSHAVQSSTEDETGAYLERIIPAFQSHGFVFVSVTQVQKQLLAGTQPHRTRAVHSTLP
jgi:predicted deacetylase